MSRLWGQWYLEYVSFNSDEAESPEALHEEAKAFANTMIEQEKPIPEEENGKTKNP
jgi:hypothetical protein